MTNDGNVVCPVCNSSESDVLEIPFPVFAHLNYLTVKDSTRVGRCHHCQSLFQLREGAAEQEMRSVLQSRDYAQSRQTDQTFVVDEFDKPVTRSFLQAEILEKHLTEKAPTILDVGTFDGRLLLELHSRFPDATCHGFDANQHLQSFFPSKANFRFWTSFDAIADQFDLVCASHSIMYIEDIPAFMGHIRRVLKPEGILFVQAPDITTNPCYLLLGDQHYFYTANVLRNVLAHFGFEGGPVDNKWFPREIVYMAKPAAKPSGPFLEDHSVYDCIRYLERKAARLRELAGNPRVGVLGTTANAAFVDAVLGDRVTNFFDENPTRIGGEFRGKSVLHPGSLGPTDVLVVPYGESGQQIVKRFGREYKGSFVVV